MTLRLMKLGLLIVGLTIVMPSITFAMSADRPDVSDKVVIEKRTKVDLAEAKIDGGIVKPEGQLFGGRKVTKFKKMVRVREAFVPELAWSVDSL